jgi:hypothetical protein
MKRGSRRELWLVAAVCLGPFALALLAYYTGPAWLPQLPGSRELVEPPASIAALPLEPAATPGELPRWSLIYAKIGPCDEPCARDLERLRQVHWALGPDLDRVRRVYLHTADGAPDAGGGELARGRLDTELGPLALVFRAERLAAGRVYIADPRGNLVVSYPPDVEQKELLRDLERLLDASGIG